MEGTKGSGQATQMEQGSKGAEGQDVKLESAGQDGKSSVEGKGSAVEKGWTTSLPKELRGLIDLEKYPTQASYVLAHETGSKKEENPGQEGNDDKGSSGVDYSGFDVKLAEDLDPFGNGTEALVNVLKENGVSTETAKKVFSAIDGSRAKSMERMVEKGKEFCEAKCKELWGQDYDANRNAMTRGVVAIVGDDAEFQSQLDSSGASINPTVAELFKRVGLLLKEDTPARSNGTSTYDPKNPYGY